MSEETNAVQENETQKTGDVNISNDVVSIVASLAAGSVSGVAGMVSSISGGIAELLGKKNMSKGVKVSVANKSVTLDLSIIVEYGAKIPDVAWEIQKKVKSEVEAMTGLSVAAVNVSVEGVEVPKGDGEKIPAQPVDCDSDDAETVCEKAEDIIEDAAETVCEKAADACETVCDKAADVCEAAAEKAESFAETLDELGEEPEAE